MKLNTKSASKRTSLPFCALFFLLTGCADTPWPTWITGEPESSVINAPRAVARPTKDKEAAWPLLGDVPQGKPQFSKPSTLVDEAEALHSDKLKAQAEGERLRRIDMPRPVEPAAQMGATEPFIVSKQEEREGGVLSAEGLGASEPLEEPAPPSAASKTPFFSALK